MRWIHCDEFVYSSAPFMLTSGSQLLWHQLLLQMICRMMLQLIELYLHVDIEIAKIAKSKMRLLLWYLSEDFAALPLFSSDTTIAVKKAIVDTL